MLYILITLTAIFVIVIMKKILNIAAATANTYYIEDDPNYDDSTKNYETIVVSDEALNHLYTHREIYNISILKPRYEFALFVNAGSTTIITTKLDSYRKYDNSQDIKDYAKSETIELDPVRHQYYIHKYVIINADVNREFKNGVFSHYIVDHELMLGDD